MIASGYRAFPVPVATFTSGPGASTLPMVVFSALRLGVTPELNALATVILLIVSAALGGAWLVQRRVASPPVVRAADAA